MADIFDRIAPSNAKGDVFDKVSGDVFDRVGPANEGERGFFGKIGESFERGGESWKADLAVYEELQAEDGDLEGAMRSRTNMQAGNALDPIDSNKMTDLVYSSAKTAGQMWETIKRSFSGGVKGAGIGAGIALAAGQLGPQVALPEELATVPAGAAAGFKLGSAEAAGIFSYRVGVGGMYSTMREQGVSHDTAKKVAQIGGVPYALLEALQLKAASPAIKKGLQEVAELATRKATTKILKKVGVGYTKTLGTEVAEELGQELIQIASEDIAKQLDGLGMPIDKKYFMDRAKRMGEVAVEATKGMALIPIPKAGVEMAIQFNAGQLNGEMESIKKDAEKQTEVKLEDIQDPVMATRAAVRASIRATETLKPIRKKERASKAAAASQAASVAGADWRHRARGEMKGVLSELSTEPLTDSIPMEVFHSLDQQIKTTSKMGIYDKANLSEAMEGMFTEGRRMRPAEIKLAQKMWGPEFAAEIQELSDIEEGKSTKLSDYLNLPRTTSASMDLSRSFRQNILMIGDIKQFVRSIGHDYKFLLESERDARLFEHETFIKHGEMISRMGLRWNDWGAKAGHATGTEQFSSRVASKIPGVKRSERAFALGGNVARLELAKKLEQQYADKGMTDKQWQDLGHVVNLLTGEGNVRAFGKIGPFLNAAFFAPRLLEARVRSITDLANPKLSGVAWKVLAKHMATFVATNMAVLGAMSFAPGVNVERDRRSTDFGKIKIGKTRIDFWGGYLPLARAVIRLGSGQRKTQSGRIVDAEAYDTIMSFLQSKLGPIGGAALDNLRGTDFIGDDVSLDGDGMTKQFYQRFVPFFMQDVADAMAQEGWRGLAAAPLAFHGVGVQSYEISPGAQVMMRKNEIAGDITGQNWDQLGPEVQEYLEEAYPEIGRMEAEAEAQANNFGWMETMAKERKNSEDKLMAALPKDVENKLREANISTGGVSRSIASGWFLNEKRYQQYQNATAKVLKKILTPVVRSDKWPGLPNEIRTAVIDEITQKVKNTIRQEIVAKANAKDLERLNDGQ